MKRYVAKKEGMTKYKSPICPRIQTMMEKAKHEFAGLICYMAGDGRFEVDSSNRATRVVDLNKHTCGYKRWELTGIPCEQDVACIYKMKEIPKKLCQLIFY